MKMDIQILPDRKKGYTATIKDLAITTQGDTLDELMYNIKEALECYYEAISIKERKPLLQKKNRRLYFDMKNLVHALKV